MLRGTQPPLTSASGCDVFAHLCIVINDAPFGNQDVVTFHATLTTKNKTPQALGRLHSAPPFQRAKVENILKRTLVVAFRGARSHRHGHGAAAHRRGP